MPFDERRALPEVKEKPFNETKEIVPAICLWAVQTVLHLAYLETATAMAAAVSLGR